MATERRTTGQATNARSAALPRLLDVDGVAEILGVTVRHVRRLVAERRIPFVKWGRYLRFDPAELEAWIDGARVGSYDHRSPGHPRRAV